MPSLTRIFKKALKIPNAVQLADAIRSGRVSPSLRITARGKTDGAGAQAHACMSALAFANATGVRYVHSPFQSVAHAEGDPLEWPRRWEDFFGLGRGEVEAGSDATAEMVDLKTFLNQTKLWKRHDIIVHAEHFHDFCNRQPDVYLPVLPAIRSKFHTSGGLNRPTHAPSGLVMAVHIRRGDVSRTDTETASRFTDDEAILATIKQCRSLVTASGSACHIDIYSEGRPEDFSAFADVGAHLKIGLDPFETVLGLAHADILITAKSAFSFVAGLLSDSIKIYEPFWSKPPSDWLTLDAAGQVDTDKLRQRIADLPNVSTPGI
tara:strand:- start:227 stop:1189 length:963 start_codon:yes stop_codon:yes gene_type:complete